MDAIAENIADHQFQKLFIEELGWDHTSSAQEIVCDERNFQFEGVAQKRGFLVVHCQTNRVVLANRGLLRKAQRSLVKFFHEHIAIYTSDEPQKQVWQWSLHLPDGRHLRHREHPFFSNSPPTPFLDRLQQLEFRLDEEDSVDLLDAVKRVRIALDTTPELNLFAKRPWYAKRSDELARAIQEGVSGAFEEFVEFHQPLARKSSKMLVRWVGMEPDDAEQIAMLGLVTAAKRFKPELGAQFSTYASYWIRQSCQRYGVDTGLPIRIPTHAFWPCYKLNFEYQRLLASHGPAKADRLFQECLEAAEITSRQWKSFQASYAMETFTDTSDDEFRELRRIKDEISTPPLLAELSEQRDAINEALTKLLPRHAKVIRLRYGIDVKEHTLEEVGQLLGITRQRAQQIQADAEDKLKFFLSREAPESYTPELYGSEDS